MIVVIIIIVEIVHLIHQEEDHQEDDHVHLIVLHNFHLLLVFVPQLVTDHHFPEEETLDRHLDLVHPNPNHPKEDLIRHQEKHLPPGKLHQ